VRGHLPEDDLIVAGGGFIGGALGISASPTSSASSELASIDELVSQL
jgi:hypothetical protein